MGLSLSPFRGLSGLGDISSSPFVAQLAQAIQTVEGYYPPGTPGYPSGSIAYRSNNPGNLRSAPSSFSQVSPVAVAGYATFTSYAVGWSALLNDISAKINRGLTLAQFLNIYAPSGDGNDPGSYTATVAAALNIDANTPLINYVNGTNTPGDGATSQPQDVGSDSAIGAPIDSGTPDVVFATLPSSFSDIPAWFGGLDTLTAAAVLAVGVLAVVAVVE